MVLLRAVAIVTGVALFGMVLGAAFGWGAATIAPSFFRNIAAGEEIEPVGFATVLGAFGGVICGGALGAFALLLESGATRRRGPGEG